MQQIKQMMWVAVLVVFSVSSFADIYVGAGLYQSSVDDSNAGVTIDGDDTTIGLVLGYKPNDYFAVEAGHYELGNYTTDDGMGVSASGPTLGISAILPLTVVDVY